MISEIKATSDTHLHQHESISSLLPLKLNSSINSDYIFKYQSGNNISSKKRIHNHSFTNSIESINNNYQKFSNNYLINTHFPIANIQRDSMMISKTSSSQLPTVPKQAGTFIHRLVNKFLSITNINENKKDLSRIKRIKREQMNTKLNSRIISSDSHTFLNNTSKRKRQRTINNNNKHCVVCRRYRNCFSILPMNTIQSLPTDSLEYTSQSPMILNNNMTRIMKNHSVLTTEPSRSLPKIQLEKIQTLNESQCQTIASAVELIFNTLISNYQQI